MEPGDGMAGSETAVWQHCLRDQPDPFDHHLQQEFAAAMDVVAGHL